MARSATNFLVIGETGTSKTTRIMRMLKDKSAIFYTFSPDDPLMIPLPQIASKDLQMCEPGKHYKVVEFDQYRDTLNNFVHNYRGGNIIYDDIRPIMKSNLSSQFEMLLTGVRHRGNDQFFIFQHSKHVPPFLCDSSKHLILLKQPLSRVDEINKNLPRYDECIKAIDWLTKHPSPYAAAYICADIKLPASRQPFTKLEETQVA